MNDSLKNEKHALNLSKKNILELCALNYYLSHMTLYRENELREHEIQNQSFTLKTQYHI